MKIFVDNIICSPRSKTINLCGQAQNIAEYNNDENINTYHRFFDIVGEYEFPESLTLEVNDNMLNNIEEIEDYVRHCILEKYYLDAKYFRVRSV